MPCSGFVVNVSADRRNRARSQALCSQPGGSISQSHGAGRNYNTVTQGGLSKNPECGEGARGTQALEGGHNTPDSTEGNGILI